MTTGRVEDVLRETQILLLDFDGPICSIFAGYPAASVARELRQFIAEQGATLPPAAMQTNDPLDVLRAAEQTGGLDLARKASAFLRGREAAAAATAAPTSGAAAAISAAVGAGRLVGVVSNNSRAAVVAYLARHGLVVGHVVARTDELRPHQLKPHPYLVQMALKGTDVPAVLVGDSVTDVQAAHAAGIPCIGYANKPHKQAALTAANADAVITSMAELAAALVGAPAPPTNENGP